MGIPRKSCEGDSQCSRDVGSSPPHASHYRKFIDSGKILCILSLAGVFTESKPLYFPRHCMKSVLTFSIQFLVCLTMVLIGWLVIGTGSLWGLPFQAQHAENPTADSNNLSIILLTNPKIQRELKLTKAQISETAEPAEKLAGQIVTLSFNPEYRDHPDKAKTELERIRAQEAILLQSLSSQQRQRLQQLYYQSLGIRLFQNTAAQKALRLSAKQEQEIAEIVATMREQLVAILSEPQKSGAGIPSPADRQANREKSDGVMNKAMVQVQQLLTPEQRERLSEIKGKPFALYATRQQP